MVVGPISILGAVFVGFAMLWAIRLSYSLRRVPSDDPLRLALTIAAWTLIHLGVLSVAAQAFFVVPDTGMSFGIWIRRMLVGSLFTIPLVLAIFGMAAARFRGLEGTSLMWLISAAGEHRVPLHEAVRSFALERTDEVGVRAARLAELLERGVGLPEALASSKSHLPIEGLLAARYGSETGDLSAAIRGLCGGTEEVDRLLRGTVEKIFYLLLLMWIVAAQISFVQIQILPIFAKIFNDFELELPQATATVIDLGSNLGWFGPLAALLGFLISAATCLFGLLYYLDWLPRDFILVGRMARRYDSALIMRTLALAVHEQRPISKVIWMLARIYPRRSVRRRLHRAGMEMNDGREWHRVLRRRRLITSADMGVLDAAQRVGNLEWALQEMADSTLRRLTYRLSLWANVIFPVMILALSAVIAITVLALFMPLIHVMEGLA